MLKDADARVLTEKDVERSSHGTVSHYAPELITAPYPPQKATSDIWAVGICILELLLWRPMGNQIVAKLCLKDNNHIQEVLAGIPNKGTTEEEKETFDHLKELVRSFLILSPIER